MEYLTNHPPGGPLNFDDLGSKRKDLIMLNILGSHDGTPAADYILTVH